MSDNASRAYSYDAQTGGVWHYTDRESHWPISEDEDSPSHPNLASVEAGRDEFTYGLGETPGDLVKNGYKVELGGHDALGYSGEGGSPPYKVRTSSFSRSLCRSAPS